MGPENLKSMPNEISMPKVAITFFLPFLFPLVLFAQQPLLDSLLQKLETAPKDTSRVSLLLSLSAAIQKEDNQQALLYAREAIKLAQQEGYAKGEVNALLQAGKVSSSLKLSDSASTLYEAALHLSRKIADYRLEIKILESLAYQSSHAGNSQKAQSLLSQFEKVLGKARKNGDSLAIANSYYTMAVIHYNLGDKERFLELAQQSLQLYETYEGQQKMKMSVNIDIGSIYDQQGKHLQALEHYFKGMQLAEQLDDKFGLARVSNNLGNLYGTKKEYDEALKYYTKGKAAAEELNNKMLSSYLQHNIASIYFALKKYNLAKEAFFQAYKVREELGLNCILASDLSSLGSIYLENGQLDSAAYYGEKAISIAESCQNPQLLAVGYGLLGDINNKLDQTGPAIAYYKKSMEVATKAGQLQHQQEAAKKLYHCYKQLGAYKEAMGYLEQFTTLNDSIFNKENTRKLTMMEAEYHFEQEKKQLAYEKEKEQLHLQARLDQQAVKSTATSVGLGLSSLLLFAFTLLFYNKKKANKLLSFKNEEINKQNKQITRQWEELEHHKVELEKRVDELDRQNEKIEKQKQEVERSYQSLNALSQLGQRITATLDLKSIIQLLYSSINSLMEVSSFGVGILNTEKHSLDFRYAYDGGEELPLFSQDLSTTDKMAVWCFNQQKEVFINDLFKEVEQYLPHLPAIPPVGKQYSESVMYVPLLVKDKIIGVITVQHFRKGSYEPYHLHILRTLAAYTAIALDNSHAYQRLNEINEELASTLKNLKQTQSQLVQSERMASLGQLTAGVAHEINNPINFVSAGIDSLSADYADLEVLLGKFSALQPGQDNTALLKEIETTKQELDLPYLLEEIPHLLKGIKSGAQRTAEIVKSLKNFTRLDEDAIKVTNIHEGLDSTLVILGNQLGDRIELIKTYGRVPEIVCSPGQLNQVFMNILTNAIQAIEGRGTITITTAMQEEQLVISIRDTGKGMTVDTRQRIFEPFFTTKEVGEGTGLGLSITHSIIEKHQGSIEINSSPGAGTELIIRLPYQKK